MGYSSWTVQSVFDYARSFPEISPVLATGGFSQEPGLTIAQEVINVMLARPYPWKWNRAIIPPFTLNSWQQDYAIVNSVGATLTNLAWLEHAVVIDINNSANPKPIWGMEVDRDLELTNYQYGRPGQCCWLPNDQMYYGTWGAPNVSSSVITFGNNPQAGQLIVNPLGQPSCPANPILQIQDSNGNFLVLTQFGTTGSTPPTAAAGALPGIDVNDGGCIWTVVDPKGQGFRVSPIPPQTGVVYLAYIIAQNRPPALSTPQKLLNPIPDDYIQWFRQGFIAQCYRRSAETKIRNKFEIEYKLWTDGLYESSCAADRERDAAGFYPSRSILAEVFNPYPGAANPYWPGY